MAERGDFCVSPSVRSLPLPPLSFPSRNGKRIRRQSITKIVMIYQSALSSPRGGRGRPSSRLGLPDYINVAKSPPLDSDFSFFGRRGMNSRPRVVCKRVLRGSRRPGSRHNKWTVPFRDATLLHSAGHIFGNIGEKVLNCII